ncbi:MAG: LCP family protein [Acidimicrobiia bacterium]
MNTAPTHSALLRIARLAIPIILVVALVAGTWYVRRASAATPALTIEKVAATSFTPSQTAPVFFLVIGNDERPGVSGARGDALHVIGFNPGANTATILNIPRDTTVPIPGHGTDKINAANAYGGSKLTAETVGNLMGITIPYVIETNFDGYVGLVNDLGGIEVDVPSKMFDSDSGSHFNPGRQTLNGDDALAFARDRHTFANGDFTRTVNQGRVLLGALRKMRAQSTDPVSAFRAMAIAQRRTKLSGVNLLELYDLMRAARNVDPDKVQNLLVPVAMGSYKITPEGQAMFADFRDDGVVQSG